MNHVIAVTNPEGRTRYVGERIWWVDDQSAAYQYSTREEAQAHIDHPNTSVHTLASKKGWIATAHKAERR